MTPDLGLLINLSVALGLGALVGAEREVARPDKVQIEFSGLRTYALISMLGFLGAYLAENLGNWFPVALFAAVTVFLVAEYFQTSRDPRAAGITSELGALVTFVVGVIAFSSPLSATIVGVATVVVLALKKTFRRFLKTLQPTELFATVKFIIVAFVVLPLLPREAIDPWGFVSLYNAWLMVVFISAISFVGYVLTKTIGPRRGLGLTGLVGGLASSTAVTSSMAGQSKQNKKVVTPFTFAVIIAGAVMFARVGFEVFVLNRELLPRLAITLGVMLAASAIVSAYLWKHSSSAEHKKKSEDLKLSSPFQIKPALKFGIFYIFILIAADLANKFFGESGVYVASAVSGLADVDAITISLSGLAREGELAANIATKGITIAVMVNTLVKLSIVQIFGSRNFFRQAAVAFGVVLASGLAAVLLV